MNDTTTLATTKKSESLFRSAMFAISMILGLIIAGKFVLSIIGHLHTDKQTSMLYVCGDILIVLLSLGGTKWALTELVSTIKFYGLNVRVSDDTLVLYTHNKECVIPLNKDVRTMFCMSGWLIIWPSRNKYEIMLIRNSLVETQFSKLELCFKSNTDHATSSEEKKMILDAFKINTFSPLNYIRWPKP